MASYQHDKAQIQYIKDHPQTPGYFEILLSVSDTYPKQKNTLGILYPKFHLHNPTSSPFYPVLTACLGKIFPGASLRIHLLEIIYSIHFIWTCVTDLCFSPLASKLFKGRLCLLSQKTWLTAFALKIANRCSLK